MNANFKDINILFSGQWDEQSVLFSETVSSRVIDSALEESSKISWEEMLNEATTSGRQLWDSELYRLEDVIEGNILSFTASTISFSTCLGMNKHVEQIKQLGISYAPKALSVSCLVSTTDGYYVFIEKSDKYFTSKKYAWVGGVLSKSEGKIESGKDVFDAARREVMEELGATEDSLVSTTLLSGYLSEKWNVCLLFKVDLSITSAQLQDLFIKQGDGEAARLVWIERDAVSKSIGIFKPNDQIRFAILNLV